MCSAVASQKKVFGLGGRQSGTEVVRDSGEAAFLHRQVTPPKDRVLLAEGAQ